MTLYATRSALWDLCLGSRTCHGPLTTMFRLCVRSSGGGRLPRARTTGVRPAPGFGLTSEGRPCRPGEAVTAPLAFPQSQPARLWSAALLPGCHREQHGRLPRPALRLTSVLQREQKAQQKCVQGCFVQVTRGRASISSASNEENPEQAQGCAGSFLFSSGPGSGARHADEGPQMGRRPGPGRPPRQAQVAGKP